MAGTNDDPDDDYPAGPITCCINGISRKVKVKDDNTWTVSLIIAWTTSLISAMLFVAAFGTVGWANVTSEENSKVINRDVGLWQECHSDTGCDRITKSTNPGPAFMACQAFAVMSLIVLFTGTGLTICHTFMPQKDGHSRFGSGALWCKVVSAILLIVLVAVFSTNWYKPKYSSPDYKRSLEYSFKLAVGSLCLEIVGLFFLYCDTVVFRLKNTSHLLEESKTVEHEGYVNEALIPRTGAYPGDSFVTSAHRHPETRLEDRVFGHMNAKSAFENFSNTPRQVAQVPQNMRTSQDSLFHSKQEISRRFTGITLSEPAYVPSHEAQINTPINKAPSQIYSPDHAGIDGAEASNRFTHQVDAKYDLHNSHVHQQTHHSNSRHMDQQGRMITSVSMYDLHNQSFSQPDERLPVSKQTKYQSNNAHRYNYPHDDQRSTISARTNPDTQSRHSASQPRREEYRNPRHTQRLQNNLDSHSQHSVRRQHNHDKQNHGQRQERDSESQHGPKLNLSGTTGDAYAHNSREQNNRSLQQQRLSTQSNGKQYTRDHRYEQIASNNQQPSIMPKRRYSNEVSNHTRNETGGSIPNQKMNGHIPQQSNQHQSKSSLYDTKPISSSRHSLHIPMKQGRSNGDNSNQQHNTETRRKDGQRPRSHSSTRLDYHERPAHGNDIEIIPRAPARRKRDQMRAASADRAGLPALTRAHSNVSLNSIVSTATTIVGGCAESEI